MMDDDGQPIPPRVAVAQLLASALKIILDAEDAERELTQDDLQRLIFATVVATVQIKQLPGGMEAHNHEIARIRAEQAARRHAQGGSQ